MGLDHPGVSGDVTSIGLVSGRMYRAHSTRRDVAIVVIKTLHSGIFLLNATSVVHIFWAGVLNRRSPWTRPALVAALSEVLVFVANRGRCPLTQLVESLGAKSGRVSDIFLPRWFADRIPQLFGPPLVIGLIAMAYHHGFTWRH